MAPSLSVVIPTYNRPSCIARNLKALASQNTAPLEVVIVDASTNDETQFLVDQSNLPFRVQYLRNPAGRGNTPNSRNLGLTVVHGEIVAFIDDDAFPRGRWAEELTLSYADPTIAGVGGRALNGQVGEEEIDTPDIGRFKPDGTMVANFNSDPGVCLEIDHMIGCNMSIRTEVLAKLGGFRDDFRAGPFGICEETDLCLRMKMHGLRMIYNPRACVDHIGAPQPGGRRFGVKYDFYHVRNNLVMILRNYGLGFTVLRYVLSVIARAITSFFKRVGSSILRLAMVLCGVFAGFAVGSQLRLRGSGGPIRRDENGRQLTETIEKNLKNSKNGVEGIAQ